MTNQALDAFFAAHEKRAFLRAQLATHGHQDDSLDIVQDSMLRFVQKAYHQRPADEWAPLFYRIVQNRIMDWHRRNRVLGGLFGLFSHRQDSEAVLSAVADPRTSTEKAVQVGLANQALIMALQALPLRQQQVFLLRAWEGLDTEATAQAMAISAGSVKTHYSRSIHKLREHLGEHWP